MKRKQWVTLLIGAVLFTTACGLQERFTPKPEASGEAQRTATKLAQLSGPSDLVNGVTASVSARSTAQAQELSIQLTKVSAELQITPVGSDGVSWITRWLTDPACKPPCWENITPGATTMDEAVKSVYQIPGVEITRLPSMSEGAEDNQSLEWSFSPSGYGWIGAENGQETVSEIHLGAGGVQLLLGNVIAAYDNPSTVARGVCRNGKCVYSILFKDGGMELDIGMHDDPIADIQAEAEISTIFFYLLSEPRLNASGLEWSGYGQYDFGGR